MSDLFGVWGSLQRGRKGLGNSACSHGGDSAGTGGAVTRLNALSCLYARAAGARHRDDERRGVHERCQCLQGIGIATLNAH
jgi:hypothetical protein